MEDNFYVFFKNFHKNKDIIVDDTREKIDDFFKANINNYNSDISHKKQLLKKIKSETLQKMTYANYPIPEKYKKDKNLILRLLENNKGIQNQLFLNSQIPSSELNKPVKVTKRLNSSSKGNTVINKNLKSNPQDEKIEKKDLNNCRRPMSAINSNLSENLYSQHEYITECSDNNNSSSLKSKIAPVANNYKKIIDKQQILESYFSNRDENYVYNSKKLRLYSARIKNNKDNLFEQNFDSEKNVDFQNDQEKSRDQNDDILVTLNPNYNENEQHFCDSPKFSGTRDLKMRPSTAMFSSSSKISWKNQIERIQSSKKTIQKKEIILNSSRIPANVKDKLENEDLRVIKSKKLHKSKDTYGPFLNIDYEEIYKVPEIKNEKVKKMLKDVNGFGPYYSHCFTCNKKNLVFYDKLDSEKAIEMLKIYKEKRKKEIMY